MTTRAAPRALHKTARYQHPPEVVWAALTDGQALAQWLMPNDFQPVAGHRFQFRIDPMMASSGVIDCEVLEIEPPRRMVWSWVTLPRPGKRAHPPLRIEWTLTPQANGTRLDLRQWGSEAMPWFWRISMAMGWGTMLRRWLPKVLGAFERTPGGLVYRRMAKPPNRRHHKTRTVPEGFQK